MHIQAGQCGNQIGAKVRPRAAPLRRAPHPARIPGPPRLPLEPVPGGREAGRRCAQSRTPSLTRHCEA